MENLKEGCEMEECVQTVSAVLKMLARCSNPVVQAGQLLGLQQADARARGLETLRELPRVVLAEAVEAEVALVPAAGAIGLDEARSDGERVSAWLAVFTLGLRNTAAEAVGKLTVKGYEAGSVLDAAFSCSVRVAMSVPMFPDTVVAPVPEIKVMFSAAPPATPVIEATFRAPAPVPVSSVNV